MPTTTGAAAVDRLPRGPHRLSRDEVVSHQRERLLRAVAAAVAAKGYGPTTIADITGRARVSRDTFYEQFASKEQCFLAAYDEVTAALLAEIVAVGTSQADYVDGVRDGIRAYLKFWSENHDAARAFTIELLAAGDAAHAHRDRILDSMTRLFNSIAVRARAEQDGLPTVPPVVARAIVVATVDLTTECVRHGRTSALPELEDDMVYLWLMGLAGHDTAAAAVAH